MGILKVAGIAGVVGGGALTVGTVAAGLGALGEGLYAMGFVGACESFAAAGGWAAANIPFLTGLGAPIVSFLTVASPILTAGLIVGAAALAVTAICGLVGAAIKEDKHEREVSNFHQAAERNRDGIGSPSQGMGQSQNLSRGNTPPRRNPYEFDIPDQDGGEFRKEFARQQMMSRGGGRGY